MPSYFSMYFVKSNKRKIYGGFALNNLILDKDKKEGFYKDFANKNSTK